MAPFERKKQDFRNPELEANVKRAVRKYYLTMHKQPLRYAYIKMLQECYTDKRYFCRNAKPVTGTVYDYVGDIGVYLCDATECDISLISEVTGELIGRPILYMAVDAYSGVIDSWYRGWFERGL